MVATVVVALAVRLLRTFIIMLALSAGDRFCSRAADGVAADAGRMLFLALRRRTTRNIVFAICCTHLLRLPAFDRYLLVCAHRGFTGIIARQAPLPGPLPRC